MRQLLIRAVLAATMTAGLTNVALAADAPVAAPADWGKALAEDAQAFHDLIADSHPGPVDVENPGFKPLLESGLATALARAKTADSYEDWYFALQEYQASFNDGHLALTGYAGMGHSWRAEWPGFLTGWKGGADTVVFSRDPAAPPLGAVLASCDGRAADALAAEFVGKGAGRWMLQSRRIAYANTLFVDQTNPYVSRPKACTFTVDGARKTYNLVWRDLPNAVRDEGFAIGRSARFFAPIGLTTYGAGSSWIGLGTFESDAASPQGKALTALQSEITTRAADLRTPGVVVFDLRGNNGGSSAWIYAMARTLWGDDWVTLKAPRSKGVEWRVSAGNLAEIKSFRGKVGDDPRILAWVDAIDAGLTKATEQGKTLWLQGDGDEGETVLPTGATTAMKARVYVLTDYGCASACLDAVDLLKALGAVQVGQETSADTLYMDVREQRLPSGRVEAVVPMKVYRGRARGNNVTAVPAHEWTGALGDTAGLQAWIAKLDATR